MDSLSVPLKLSCGFSEIFFINPLKVDLISSREQGGESGPCYDNDAKIRLTLSIQK